MAIQNDGFKTLISFSADTDVQFEEKEVTPPGVTAGGPIDTTTMRNTAWRTMFPKSLRSLTEASLTVAYDPALYDEIVAMVNDNQLITITFPAGETLSFWGWLDEFTPNASVEGEQPTAEITIQPSNQNDSGVEVAPVLA